MNKYDDAALCYLCGNPVDVDDFCNGCGELICAEHPRGLDDGDYVGHLPEDHDKENDNE